MVHIEEWKQGSCKILPFNVYVLMKLSTDFTKSQPILPKNIKKLPQKRKSALHLKVGVDLNNTQNQNITINTIIITFYILNLMMGSKMEYFPPVLVIEKTLVKAANGDDFKIFIKELMELQRIYQFL